MRTSDSLRGSSLSPTLEERARLATERARKLAQTTWTPFLRMLTGNPKLRVSLTGGTPRTDGDTVYLRVPIELGDNHKHEKLLCGKRDEETLIQLCEACAVEDDVFAVIYHEAAHMVFDSFQALSEADKARMFEEAVRLSCDGDEDSPRAKHIRKLLSSPKLIDGDLGYMPLASTINPYLPGLLNAAEDVRVNNAMTEARPGVGKMLAAMFSKVWAEGTWEEAPLNSQVSIAVYCEASGLKWRTAALHPWVEVAMSDPDVLGLCDEVRHSKSVRQTYRLTVNLMELLRERYGFFKLEDGEGGGEGEPGGEEGEGSETEGNDGRSGKSSTPSDGDPEDGESGEGSSGKSGPKDDADDGETSESGSGDGESDEDDGTDGESASGGDGDDESPEDDSEGGDSDDGDGEAAQPSSSENWGSVDDVASDLKAFSGHDQDKPTDLTPPDPSGKTTPDVSEVNRALSQEEHFDKPSVLSGGLKEFKYDDDPEAAAWANKRWMSYDPIEVEERVIAPALKQARITFTENRKGKHERNLRAGSRLDGKVLAVRVATDDGRVFKKRSRPKKRDYFVEIGLDCSGSTSGHRITLIKQVAMAWAELFNRLGIKFAMHGHSGDGSAVTINVIKAPEEPWTDKTRRRLQALGPYSANLDGHTLEYYRKLVERQRESDKMILYVTDGCMPAENYREELEVLQDNIRICQQRGIKLVGIGIENDDPKAHGLDTIRLDGVDDLLMAVKEIEKRLE